MRTGRLGVLALLGVGLVGWSTALGAEKREMTPLADIPRIGDIEMLKRGDAAPPFSLVDLNGKPFDMETRDRGTVCLLVFWSIFCEPCKAEMPLIQRLYEQYGAKGLEVLAIAMDGDTMKKSIQGLISQQGYTFRVFLDKLAEDESFMVADPYGVAGTPTLYLVGKDGKIAFAELGRTPLEVLEQGIQKALASN